MRLHSLSIRSDCEEQTVFCGSPSKRLGPVPAARGSQKCQYEVRVRGPARARYSAIRAGNTGFRASFRERHRSEAVKSSVSTTNSFTNSAIASNAPSADSSSSATWPRATRSPKPASSPWSLSPAPGPCFSYMSIPPSRERLAGFWSEGALRAAEAMRLIRVLFNMPIPRRAEHFQLYDRH